MSLLTPTWWKFVLLAAVFGLSWVVYQFCPSCAGNSIGAWSLHLTSVPGNCATFSLPDKWVLPDEQDRLKSVVEFYELRRARGAPQQYLIGMRGFPPSAPGLPVTPLYSNNKFAFRFRSQSGQATAMVDNIQPASEQDWVSAERLPQVDTHGFEDPDPRMVEPEVRNAVSYRGRQFPRDHAYSQFSSRRMVSVREILIAIPSHSGPDTEHGLSFNPIPDPWWRAQTIDIFRVSTRTRIARIRGWVCVGGLGQAHLITWQGDEFLTMPITIDAREVLMCQFSGQ